MANNLTFKQYLEQSKQQLREAVKTIPQKTTEYTVKKYCKLPVGESKQERFYLPLKPKNKVVVEWLYNDVDNPTPVRLTFEGIDDAGSDFTTFWSGSKLLKWLRTNAREDAN